MLDQVNRELLVDLLEHIDSELLQEIENYATCPGKSLAKMRASLDAEALEYVEPLEELKLRIEVALADNAGAGI